MRATRSASDPPPTGPAVINPAAVNPAAARHQPLTLTALAHQARARLLNGPTTARTTRTGTTLWLVPVHGRDGAWLVLRARGRTPQLTPLRVPVDPATLDLGLQIDLLLRWIDPPPAPHGTGAAGSVPADVDRLAPLALLVERAGDAELTDTDLGWWQAFRIAAGIVGRRPVTACLACPAGVRDIRDQRDTWPQPA